MTPTGLNQVSLTMRQETELGNPEDGRAAQGAADFADADLARIVAVWPSLPPTVRAAMVNHLDRAVQTRPK
jgi:hypothetical protein